ncbi:MAG: translation initiation factor [Planctomycetota bacterium]|jgi:translation initiation factor 1
MSKKKLSGQGWEFIPADSGEKKMKITDSLPPAEQSIKLKTERRSGNKVVTLISGFVLNEKDLKKLAKGLKAFCGAGGKAVDDVIEVQGDNVEKVSAFLSKNGYKL